VTENKAASPPRTKLNQIKSYAALVERVTASLKGETAAAVTYHDVQLDHTSYPLVKVVLGKALRHRAVLTAGLHGDEPAGTEALCEFLEQRSYLKLVEDWELTLLPCLNPWGYEHNVRENQEGKDLNREFNSPRPPAEVRFVHAILQQPFDLLIDLHEDRDSPGYYLYQSVDAEAEAAVGRQILDRVGKVTSINMNSEIEGRSADRGVIDGPCNPDTLAWWPLAAYAQTHGVKRVLTLEAGGSYSIEARVQAHLLAIEAAIECFSRPDRA
jgi:predicted deacylase